LKPCEKLLYTVDVSILSIKDSEMIRNLNEWVILGITMEGEVFAYPDWTEQLCGMLAEKSDHNRLSYSDYLHPVYIDGLPAVVLEAKLEEVDLESFKTVSKFAMENQLKVRSGRAEASMTAKHPVLGVERRDLSKQGG
jgi:hypothetical protein